MTFEEAYEQYYNKIVTFANKRLCNTMLAEDVVQTAFLKAWLHWHEAQPGRELYWLYRIALNQIIDVLRHEKKLVMEPIDDAIPHPATDLFSQLEETIDFVAILPEVPEKCRAVLQLRAQQLTFQEIGEVLHITVKCAKTRALRGRAYIENRNKEAA